MKTRTKLVLAALGFVALVTALALWQAMPRDIDQVARRISFTDADRSGILRYGVSDYPYKARVPVVPGRAGAKVEAWRSHSYGVGWRTFVVLRVKNYDLPDPDTWSALLGDAWKKEHREFWLLSTTGEKPRCVATAPASKDPAWSILSWSPERDWVYLLKSASYHSHEVYALPLGK
ncbi:hypothetical protein [Armatimonas rosea]|uniref:Uncharacterized protein n=1 Tax=Armatimonas rosea TaxID=685828 RepID=A0A7W9SKR1_ARMRO|nr:hypothetical protein [Armatimonas rosea]MBB6048431.1 hypothetical protein [Armatimonas rosea]